MIWRATRLPSGWLYADQTISAINRTITIPYSSLKPMVGTTNNRRHVRGVAQKGPPPLTGRSTPLDHVLGDAD